MLRRSVSSLAWTTRTSGFRSFSSSPEIRSVAIEDQFSEKEARFADMDLHPKSLKALRRHGLHNATEIQRKTYSLVVSGRDVVAVGNEKRSTGAISIRTRNLTVLHFLP